jgi:hypothetical protein
MEPKLATGEWRAGLLLSLRKLAKSDTKHQANYDLKRLLCPQNLQSRKRISMLLSFLNDDDLIKNSM